MQYGHYSSGMPPRRRKRRIKARFFIFLLVFFGLIALTVWGVASLLSGSSILVLGYGRIEEDSRAEAILIHKEEIGRLSSYSKVIYHATENQSVKVGDPIMTTYSQGYGNAQIQNLEDIRRQIAELQEANLSGIRDSDVDEFNRLIGLKTDEIKAFTRGARTGVALVEIERDLRTLLTQKQKSIKDKQKATGNTQLQDLYDRETEAETKIQSWTTVHTSTMDGRVSYIFDGYENVLTPDRRNNLTVEGVAGLIRNTAAPTVPPEEKDKFLPPIFRVVTPDEWYTLLLVREKDWTLAGGAKCELSFVGFEDMMFTATVESITGDGDQALVVLNMTEDIGPLINQRKLTAMLGSRVEGLMVPVKAIKDNGGIKGVYLEDGQTFVSVNVKAKDDHGYMLVESVEEGKLGPGTRIRAK